ncbi:MAG: O-antigen ligase family protein [Crocinitomicaceae bacterium]|nr:O-antigen ligase family protein [Crocinitomicaceae bacterium]
MTVTEKNKSIFEKLSGLWMSALVISQVLFPKFVALWIIFGVLHTIYGIVKKQRKFEFSWIAAGFASLYLFYVFGLLFSENIPLGLSYLENKLSFLILAFVFSFPPPKQSLRIISLSFISSVVIAILLGFVNSWHSLQELPELGVIHSFTGVFFSYLHHPSYFAVYVLLAAFLLIDLRLKVFKGKLKPLFWFILLLLAIAYLATISLAAYLFLAGLIGILMLRFIFKKVPKPYSWFTVLILPAIFYIFIWSISTIQVQMKSSLHFVREYLQNPTEFINSKDGYISGDETRIIMWTVTAEEIIANPFGVGTGSVDVHLSNRLKSHGLHDIAKMDERKTILFNPHNQFLQLALELGILGLILFLSLIIFTIRKAYQQKNWILLMLILSLTFNSLFESMLQRQSGIVFYTFFILLFSLSYSKETKEIIK